MKVLQVDGVESQSPQPEHSYRNSGWEVRRQRTVLGSAVGPAPDA